MKLLLAFNGSKLSEAALHAVITQRRPENTKVKVLKVIPLDVTDEEVRQAQASLDLTAQAQRTAGFKAESTVLRDIVLESIIGVAGEWDADLIVLGWHGRTTVMRFLFGSVATKVIHAASCSVELLRFRPERCESEACRLENEVNHENSAGD
jgi:nucleotide-binding universal stress UspA family protein